MKRWFVVGASVLVFALLAPVWAPPPAPQSARAGALPTGFREDIVFSGFTQPTSVRFAPGGQVFVAEKSGRVLVFDDLTDTSPTLFADLSTNVYNFWDRGLLGLALDPQFPTKPYVYALYSLDALIGGQPPHYGTPGVLSDPCPNPPGANTNGCVTGSRLVRLSAIPSGGSYVMTGSEQVLVEDWCGQFVTHTIGTVAFGADGALYAGGGDGANPNAIDYGQYGSPLNPCGDPPGGVGATLTPPTAEGGALRSQDLRTPSDPTSLDGTIIRVDPSTGQALSTNPLAGSTDPNARRIVAYGFRNPFRFTFRPGTNEIWVGDVGASDWEEINRVTSPTSQVTNFGWPCYEGSGHQAGYEAVGLNICTNLYGAQGAVTGPYYMYNHAAQVVPGETCATGSSSMSGVAFAPSNTTFPSDYQGALFFADYSRNCIWVMKTAGQALPQTSAISTFEAGAAAPVDLGFGPDGNLYYADLTGGTIRRISPTTNVPPPSGTSYLSNLSWTSVSNGCGPIEKDTSNGNCGAGDGNALTLNGVTFAKGLGAHALSDVSYYLGGTCSRFKASIGIDDEASSNGSVTFQVYADSTKVFDSGVMTGTSATQTVDVSIAGANNLRLVLDPGADNNWDHADWALARVDCGTGSDTTPPTVTGQSPASGATGVAVATNVMTTFSESMDATTLTSATFTLVKQGTTTPIAAGISYASGTATLDASSDLQSGTAYTATVKGGSSGAKDLAGNALASDVSWSFTTASAIQPPPSGTSYLSNLSWTSVSNGCGPIEKDTSNGNCGAGDGNALTLNGVTFAKGLGAHALSDVSYYLGGTCSRFKASIGIDDEASSNGSVTFQVYADSTKVFDSGVMTGTSATQTVDVSIAGANNLRLVLDPGADNNWDHADWALARVDCGTGSDTTPPTVTGQSPASGATGVAVATNVMTTFSESMDATTLTSATFTLVKQGTTTPIAAGISYASGTATLDASSDLQSGTAYTATVKGGSSGAKDLAGNALASDVSWSFTTAVAANQPPTPLIDAPPSGTTWKVGDTISFSGHATDPEQGTLPASALSWSLVIQHCPSNCHTHPIQTWTGVASGSFSAPDHEYPSWLELTLSATDAGGLSSSQTLRLDPQTVILSFGSAPSGLQIGFNTAVGTTPFTRTVIIGSANSVSATSPQTLNGTTYTFSSWSDGGTQTHVVTAPATAATYTATYRAQATAPVNTTAPSISGSARVGRTLTTSDGSWTGTTPMTFSYQWLRCSSTTLSSCTAITEATEKSYVIVSTDVGYRLRAQVTAINVAGSSSATSAPAAAVKR